ncbi:hypothetical protein EWI07_06235 [Sporolactobacillus sp. THM7-4]|nr:hypothetical protein EWI07_06235 [Sporolactobacillus sp. THM7-4]
MNDTAKRSGKGLTFLSGLLVGGILGGAAVFLIVSPSGRQALRNIEQQSMTLKDRGTEFIKLAKEKTISLKKNASNGKPENTEQDQMIPIPKDYV